MNRRGFLSAILAAGVAPAVVGSGILMPVRKIVVPDYYHPGIPTWPGIRAAQMSLNDLTQRALEDAIIAIRCMTDSRGLLVIADMPHELRKRGFTEVQIATVPTYKGAFYYPEWES